MVMPISSLFTGLYYAEPSSVSGKKEGDSSTSKQGPAAKSANSSTYTAVAARDSKSKKAKVAETSPCSNELGDLPSSLSDAKLFGTHLEKYNAGKDAKYKKIKEALSVIRIWLQVGNVEAFESAKQKIVSWLSDPSLVLDPLGPNRLDAVTREARRNLLKTFKKVPQEFCNQEGIGMLRKALKESYNPDLLVFLDYLSQEKLKNLFEDQFVAYLNGVTGKYSKVSSAIYGIRETFKDKAPLDWTVEKMMAWLSDPDLKDDPVTSKAKDQLIWLLEDPPPNQSTAFYRAREKFLSILKPGYVSTIQPPKKPDPVVPQATKPAPTAPTPLPPSPKIKMPVVVRNGAKLKAKLATLPAGKFALVAFSADWSPLGNDYKRTFVKLAKQYKNKYVMIFAEGTGGKPSKIKTGTEKDWEAYGVDGYPTVAFIDAQGRATGVVDLQDPAKSLEIAQADHIERKLELYASALGKANDENFLRIKQALVMLAKSDITEAVPVAIKFSKNSDIHLQSVGEKVLNAAIPYLIASFEDEDANVRAVASATLTALNSMGKAIKSSDVLACLQHPDSFVRGRAARYLGKAAVRLQGAAKRAVSALKELENDPDLQVQKYAREAREKIEKSLTAIKPAKPSVPPNAPKQPAPMPVVPGSPIRPAPMPVVPSSPIRPAPMPDAPKPPLPPIPSQPPPPAPKPEPWRRPTPSPNSPPPGQPSRPPNSDEPPDSKLPGLEPEEPSTPLPDGARFEFRLNPKIERGRKVAMEKIQHALQKPLSDIYDKELLNNKDRQKQDRSLKMRVEFECEIDSDNKVHLKITKVDIEKSAFNKDEKSEEVQNRFQKAADTVAPSLKISEPVGSDFGFSWGMTFSPGK